MAVKNIQASGLLLHDMRTCWMRISGVKMVLNAVTQSCGLPPESGEQLRHTSYEDDVDE